ncbi:hypothetical protein [Bacillus thuringiensis]|nr:hypothetical protein [Bacillus thuringiensis]
MVKIDFDKVMIVFGMGDGLRTNRDLLSSEQLTHISYVSAIRT